MPPKAAVEAAAAAAAAAVALTSNNKRSKINEYEKQMEKLTGTNSQGGLSRLDIAI